MGAVPDDRGQVWARIEGRRATTSMYFFCYISSWLAAALDGKGMPPTGCGGGRGGGAQTSSKEFKKEAVEGNGARCLPLEPIPQVQRGSSAARDSRRRNGQDVWDGEEDQTAHQRRAQGRKEGTPRTAARTKPWAAASVAQWRRPQRRRSRGRRPGMTRAPPPPPPAPHPLRSPARPSAAPPESSRPSPVRVTRDDGGVV